MTQQPEAMRLADELEAPVGTQSTYSAMQQAAAELRRLHAENEVMRNVANRGGHIAVAMSRIADLEAQRDALLEALQELMVAADRVSGGPVTWLGKARAAIAKATGEQV